MEKKRPFGKSKHTIKGKVPGGLSLTPSLNWETCLSFVV